MESSHIPRNRFRMTDAKNLAQCCSPLQIRRISSITKSIFASTTSFPHYEWTAFRHISTIFLLQKGTCWYQPVSEGMSCLHLSWIDKWLGICLESHAWMSLTCDTWPLSDRNEMLTRDSAVARGEANWISGIICTHSVSLPIRTFLPWGPAVQHGHAESCHVMPPVSSRSIWSMVGWMHSNSPRCSSPLEQFLGASNPKPPSQLIGPRPCSIKAVMPFMKLIAMGGVKISNSGPTRPSGKSLGLKPGR